jgi:hypothetical protein
MATKKKSNLSVGRGEKLSVKAGAKGAPTKQDFVKSAKTAKKAKK